MKKPYFFSIALICVLLLWGCPNSSDESSTANTSATTTVIDERKSRYSNPVIIDHHFVVRFNDTLRPKEKDSIRGLFPLVQDAIKKCSCGDNNLELWQLDVDNTDPHIIIEKERGLTDNKEYDGLEGDPLFEFNVPQAVKGYKGKRVTDSVKQSLTAGITTGQKINIAIIDSGIDFYKNRESEPFLYATNGIMDNCTNQISGWNFVQNNYDVTDYNSHGTYVTKIITSQLDDKKVDYRILPIKAFDAHGRGSYWDIVCAMGYVNEIHKKEGNLHLVNASFGHTVPSLLAGNGDSLSEGPRILKNLIEELEEGVLVISSAGNDDNDNDLKGHEHFPSGFDSKNIFGVGGYVITENAERKIDGNYGKYSIDVAAPYEAYSYSFMDSDGNSTEDVRAAGSSYSAAFTTARLAELIDSNFQEYLGATGINSNLVKTDFLDESKPWISRDTNLKDSIVQGNYQIK